MRVYMYNCEIPGIGFSFNQEYSKDFNVVMKSDDRSLLPQKRKKTYVIEGVDADRSFGDYNLNTRIIRIRAEIRNSVTLEELRAQVRSVSQWLTGEGLLIFDDEPDVGYQAEILSAIALNQTVVNGLFSVDFKCQPLAEEINFQQDLNTLTASPSSTTITPNSTVDTCCILSIKNTGITDIQGILISRKAVI